MAKEEISLDRKHLTSNLEERIAKGALFNIFTRLSNMIIQFGSVAILARLLEPKDFGLVAMVGVALELFMNFKDMGLSTATIQREEITQEQVNSLFWLNVLAGLLLTLIMASLGPLVSKLYNEPRLLLVTVCLGTVFLFEGLSAQHRALMERNMLFKSLSIVQITSQLVSKVVAIVAAYLGCGYWSLVFMGISVPLSRSVLLWSLLTWRPRFPSMAKGAWEMLKFGLNISGTRLLEFVTEQWDNFLIGKYLGPHALGIYSRSYNFLASPEKLILWPFSQTMTPALSAIQDDPDRLREKTVWAVERASFVLHPICLWIFLCSKELIYILLGPKWHEATAVCMILAFWAFARSTPTGSWWMLIVLNRVARFIKWRLVETFSICAGILIGLKGGVNGVALGLAISTLSLKVPEVLYCYRETPIKIRHFFSSIMPSFTSSFITLGIMSYLSYIFSFSGLLLNFLFKTVFYFGLYLFINWVIFKKDPIYMFKEFIPTKRSYN